jgi:hypothetical protein
VQCRLLKGPLRGEDEQRGVTEGTEAGREMKRKLVQGQWLADRDNDRDKVVVVDKATGVGAHEFHRGVVPLHTGQHPSSSSSSSSNNAVQQLLMDCLCCGPMRGALELKRRLQTDSVTGCTEADVEQFVCQDSCADILDVDMIWILHLANVVDFARFAEAQSKRLKDFIRLHLIYVVSGHIVSSLDAAAPNNDKSTNAATLESACWDILMYLYSVGFSGSSSTKLNAGTVSAIKEIFIDLMIPDKGKQVDGVVGGVDDTQRSGQRYTLDEADLRFINEALSVLLSMSSATAFTEFCMPFLRLLLGGCDIVCSRANLAHCNYLMGSLLPESSIEKGLDQLLRQVSSSTDGFDHGYSSSSTRLCQSFLRLVLENKCCRRSPSYAKFMENMLSSTTAAILRATADKNANLSSRSLLFAQMLWLAYGTVNARYLELDKVSEGNPSACQKFSVAAGVASAGSCDCIDDWFALIVELVCQGAPIAGEGLTGRVDRTDAQFLCVSLCEVLGRLDEDAVRAVQKAFKPLLRPVSADARIEGLDVLLSLCKERLRILVAVNSGRVLNPDEQGTGGARDSSALDITPERIQYWANSLRRTQCLPVAVSQLCSMQGSKGVLNALLHVCGSVSADSMSSNHNVKDAQPRRVNAEVHAGCKAIILAMTRRDPPLCSEEDGRRYLAQLDAKMQGTKKMAADAMPGSSETVETGLQQILQSLSSDDVSFPSQSRSAVAALGTMVSQCINRMSGGNSESESKKGRDTELTAGQSDALLNFWADKLQVLFSTSFVSAKALEVRSDDRMKSSSRSEDNVERLLVRESALVAVILHALLLEVEQFAPPTNRLSRNYSEAIDDDNQTKRRKTWLPLCIRLVSTAVTVECVEDAIVATLVTEMQSCATHLINVRRLWPAAVVLAAIDDQVQNGELFLVLFSYDADC